jgi:transcriptional regulator with XRE-family HTH domain
MITAKQIRAARALIGWRQSDLAEKSGLAEITVRKIEKGDCDPRASSLARIEVAFNDVGIVFESDGVRKP